MLGDPLQKVTPGQPLQIPAEAWNAFVEAALAHRGRRFDQLYRLCLPEWWADQPDIRTDKLLTPHCRQRTFWNIEYQP